MKQHNIAPTFHLEERTDDKNEASISGSAPQPSNSKESKRKEDRGEKELSRKKHKSNTSQPSSKHEEPNLDERHNEQRIEKELSQGTNESAESIVHNDKGKEKLSQE